MDATIFDSALSHTRLKKEEKIARPLLDVFVCGQVSSLRLYRFKGAEKQILKIFESNFLTVEFSNI